jgi:hypothetical protein
MRFILKPTIILIIILIPNISFPQDSTLIPPIYTSFGFQFSQVSGTGISIGRDVNSKYRLRGTIGIISTDLQTRYSFGFDAHYYLNSNTKYNVFIGPSIGRIGGSKEDPKTRLALATGLEVPLTGSTPYKNICLGLVLYYPTYYVLSGNINVTPGVYLSYNF